tara:strand:- start:34632 stop:35543 length:912 start_codon:yes stop_codon:yes gene_type:complete
MIKINIQNEYSPLKTVILGIAEDVGPPPNEKDVYDPGSLFHIQNNSYPLQKDLLIEIDNFHEKLLKHDIDVIRPKNISDCNQIFTRDLGFVISNIFFMSNIVPNREKEIKGIEDIIKRFNVGVIKLPDFMHIEGGDVIIHNDKIFIGTYSDKDYSSFITARTNNESIKYLKMMIPGFEIIPIDIKKSNTNIYENTLHLDCCFQTISENKAIICPDGFKNSEDIKTIVKIFGEENVFKAQLEEFTKLTSNVLVVSPDVIISHSKFTRLNSWLRNKSILVEEVDYTNVSKMSGLFRCSTLPLNRE